MSHGAIFLATCNAILLLSKGGSSRYSDRCISRKCDVTMGTVGATERRRREHPGGSGGMLTQNNFLNLEPWKCDFLRFESNI